MSLSVKSKLLLSGLRAAPLGAVNSTRNESSYPRTQGTRMELIPKGTGGRSSFNGIVATVFGNTGHLGRYVINALGKCGTMIILPYRGDPYFVQRLKVAGDLGQIVNHPFSLKDEQSVAQAMQYSDVVINLIGRDFETRNFTFDDVHVKGARTIARLARECGVKKLIHFSALNVAEKPQVSMFGKSKFLSSKWEGEQAVRQEFPGAIVFRPADMYGHEDNFFCYYTTSWRVLQPVVSLWKMGENIYKAPVHMSDVAAAVRKAIMLKGNEGEIYQAVGPNAYELSKLVRYMQTLMDRHPAYIDMRLDPFFFAKVVIQHLLFKSPKIPIERVRREHNSDIVDFDLKTIADLGVKLTRVEDCFPYELRRFRPHEIEMANHMRPAFVEPPPRISY